MRDRPINRFWENWSTRKLKVLNPCPRVFWFEIVAKKKVPINIEMVFGRALHYLFKKFFTLKNGFKSSDSLVKFWIYYWNRVFDESEIILKTAPNRSKYMAIGIEILKKFYQINADYRNFYQKKKIVRSATQPSPSYLEKKFKFSFNGISLEGVWDRIQPLDDNNEAIWDYKSGLLASEAELWRDYQFTIYQLAYQHIFGKIPSSMFVYHCNEGKLVEVRLRQFQDFQILHQILVEARAKVKFALTGSAELSPKDFQYFQSDMQHHGFVPKSGNWCKRCIYDQLCRQLTVDKNELGNDLFQWKLKSNTSISTSEQLRLFL